MALAFDAPRGLSDVTDRAVTAIVVVHGSSAATVSECLTSLIRSREVDVRIVLVDNASPDGGRACQPWRDHAQVQLVTAQRNRGFAAGVNLGLAHRRPEDLVLLLNDDAVVEPQAIALCAAALLGDPTVVAVAPRVMLANQRELIDSVGVVVRPNGEAFNAFIGQLWTGQVADGADVLGPCFGAGLFRWDAFEPAIVGPPDERYFLYYEDIDWALRAQRAGWRSIAATNAVVFHQHAASTRSLGEPARYELVQRNLLVCAAKNLTPRTAARVWCSRIVVHTKGLITGPYRLQRVRAVGRAGAMLPRAIWARRDLPRRRAVAESALFRYSVGLEPDFDPLTFRAGS